MEISFAECFSLSFVHLTILTMSSTRNVFHKDALNCPTKGVPSNTGKFFCSQQLLFGEVLICCLLINEWCVSTTVDLELDTLGSLSIANSKYTSCPHQSDAFNLSIK